MLILLLVIVPVALGKSYDFRPYPQQIGTVLPSCSPEIRNCSLLIPFGVQKWEKGEAC